MLVAMALSTAVAHTATPMLVDIRGASASAGITEMVLLGWRRVRLMGWWDLFMES
ncbi:hypothetical protein B0T18DRAFT_422604 [Schizothecium vesticola]|uniref:Uncharacterized protein n=1 Tax=Schizothecium vesticola TaxID=314040 RepID=A0AA40BQU2_9PEZI|nr:hypothetical protein B0T18DRAFT_422604 [Schizothecium vesticola]